MRETVGGIKHPAFRDALALTRAGGREATGRYLVEDAGMVRQAIAASDTKIHAVFATPEEAPTLEAMHGERTFPLYIVTGGLITKLVGTGYSTAVTAVAVLEQRTVSPEDLLQHADGLILCGEKIQDPRNVGVLIRTAEAAGCAGLLLSADSAEPFSRQAVRSTTGSILRLPIALTTHLPDTLTELKRRGATVMTASGESPKLLYDADLSVRPLVLVVGNEQDGVSEAVLQAADADISLPMAPNGADSLNVTVAAGAMVYEAIRQRMAK
ncbi:MAG: RNA methyltransferase [Armatimonadaceae bacterium]